MGDKRPMTIEELVGRLEEADIWLRRNGDGWRGSCPACGGDDRLTVFEDLNGDIGVKCWGRCKRDAILASVGLSWRDLRDQVDDQRSVEELRRMLFVEPQGLDDGGGPTREALKGGEELLYRGQSVTLFSERGAGKSTVATLLGVSVAASGGKAYYWDRENTAALMRARVDGMLEAHDDWPDVVEEGTFIYRAYPRLDPNQPPEHYGEVFDGFALVVFDSMREAISELRGNSNDDHDISNFISRCVTPVIARGGAVMVLDNVGHEYRDRPKGSGAKLDAIPQAFKVSCAEPFTSAELGRIEIECTRSRFGDIGRTWTMRVGAGTWELPRTRDENPDAKAAREIATKRSAFERICVAELGRKSPQGWKALTKAARDRGVRTRAQTLREWLSRLVADPASELSHDAGGYFLQDISEGVPDRGSQGGFPPGISLDTPPEHSAELERAAEDVQGSATPRCHEGTELLEDCVVFDTETTGLDCRSDDLRLVCFARGMHYEVLEHPGDQERIQRWLELDLPYVAHNIGFDLGFLEQHGYRLPPPERWHDTTLIVHVAGRRLPGQTALKAIARSHVKEGELPESLLAPEQELNGWLRQARRQARKNGRRLPQLGDAPRRLLDPYLRSDVQLTQWAHGHYGARLNGQGPILDLERRLLPAVYATEQRGVPIDVGAAKAFRRETKEGVKRLLDRVRELAGNAHLNPQSTRQVEDAFTLRSVDLSGLPRTEKTKQLMLTAQTLESIDDDLARALLELRAEKKMADYAEGLFRHAHGDRLYGTFRQVGTTTGRMSSGNPNLQNFPKEDSRIRHLIRAGEGKTLVGADLDSVELRLLAYYAPGGALEASFANGTDPHQQTADAVGVSRDEGKRINYAILYGAGAPRIAQILGCDRGEAKAVLDRWYRAYPEVGRLKHRIGKRLDECGYVTTVLGRHQHVPPELRYRALNYLISGSAADLFKLAAIELHEAGLEAVLYVHDEIVLEADVGEAEDAANQLSAVLTSGAGKVRGLRATAATASRWSECKE